MFRFSHAALFRISGFVWLAVGIMLLNTGLVIMMRGFETGSFNPENYSSFFSWLSVSIGRAENAAILLIGIGILIGFVKGRIAMQKASYKSYERITKLENPTSLSNLYTKANLFLILLMVAIGMSMKYLGIANDVRGLIDVAVGCALMQGAVSYFQYATFVKKKNV